jgi:multicomponent Na+:H+ antiporter subunit D
MLVSWTLIAICLPFVSTLGILAAHRWPNLREAVSLAAAAALFAIVLGVLYEPVVNGQAIEIRLLTVVSGLEIAFRPEPLGMMFALIASFLWFVTVIYAIGYMRGHNEENQTRFYCFFAIAIGAVMAIAFAENLLTLFIFYEMLTLCTYPLVTHAGTDKARQGGRVYLGILLTTSIVFFLLGIAITWAVAGSLSFKTGGLLSDQASPAVLSAILVLFALGIGKAAMMPFHRWLPAAMVAPTPVSALLHAVAVVKAGVFTLLKVCVLLFGLETLRAIPATEWLLYLAAATILLAALIALRQDNLKARLAYSTVSQLGYISLGALLATSAGVTGSGLHIAMHAFGKITLFFCAGAILVAAHKTEVSELRGIGRRMPLTMTAFFIGSLCIIGLPPTGGAWSKWNLLLGTLEAGQWALMAALMISSLLSIAYLMPISVRAFFTPRDDAGASSWNWSEVHEAPWPSLLAMGITSLGCLALFFYPELFYRLITVIAEPGAGL